MKSTQQLLTLLTKNNLLLTRHPLHLLNLLFNSVPVLLLAYAAGRSSRGPSGEFPPLTPCGQVDPLYYMDKDYYETMEVPITLNEVWRDGLPIWILTLSATFSGVSVYLLLRSELVSRRLGTLRSAGLKDGVYWISWLLTFTACGIINSCVGSGVAMVLDVHVFQSVGFGILATLLFFLNVACVCASFLLAALCGTISSTTLTVVTIIGMIVAGSAPAIGVAVSRGYFSASDSTDTYGGSYGDGGAFWAYASTSRTEVEYNYTDAVFNYSTYDYDFMYEPMLSECEMPIVSWEEGRNMKTARERDEVLLEDVFMGCYVIPGASTTFLRDKGSYFFWYLLPQTAFTMAFSNILGFTALPGSKFSLSQASKSPEILATEALSSYFSRQGLSAASNVNNEPSLFPEGSTVLPETYYYYYWNYNEDEPLNNCPSSNVIQNMCYETTTYSNADCQYAKAGYPTTSSPSVNDCIGFLASLVVLYFIAAYYIGAVFPMRNGAALKFYFPLQPSFWCAGSRGKKRDDANDLEVGGTADGEVSEGEVGVEAVGVSKSYGKVEALKPFSLKLNVGEVTSLLGHNGAGKSTFVNILCCEQSPSSGDIYVFGESVKSHSHFVRSILGECKQDDYLWPELSAQEHLELFAGIRGLAREKVATEVQLWLESVDLDLVKDNYTSTFSGGMKRRLSLALSTIGPSKLIVLDEPTTGMDPISRRYVWDHITAIKQGRVILLTTHAMEEADQLSDSVAIICGGELVASGSPLELKHEYGSAVQFSMIVSKEHIEEVAELIKQHFASVVDWISLESSTSGYLTLNINKIQRGSDEEGVEASSLSSFIGWLEQENSLVEEFTISNSSLEEVFLAVAKNHQVDQPHRSENHRTRTCCCCCRRRQPTQTSAEAPDQDSPTPLQTSAIEQQTLSDFSRNMSIKTQTIALFRFYMKRNWSGRPSLVNWMIYGILCVGNVLLGLSLVLSWPDETMYFFLLVTVFVLSMILIPLISTIYSDKQLGLFKMMQTQSLLDTSFLLGTSLYSWVVSFLYAFVVLSLFYATPIYRDADTPDCSTTDGSNYTSYYDNECGWAKFGGKPVVSDWSRTPVLFGQYDGEDVTVYAHQAAGSYGVMFGIIVVFSLSCPGAVLSSSFLPGYRVPLIGVSILLLAACVSPLILIISNYSDPYFFGNCTEMIESVTNCSHYYPSFTLENANKTFVQCVGFQITSPAIYCLPQHASILPQIGLFQTLSLSFMSNVVFYSEPEEYAREVFVPGLEGASCVGNSCPFMFAQTKYLRSLGYMFLGSVMLLMLGTAIAYFVLFPSPCLIRSRHKLERKTKTKYSGATDSEEQEMEEVESERNIVNSLVEPIVEASSGTAPAISHHALKENRDQLPPVVMHKLQKVYPSLGRAPPKVALTSLDLHVPYGQVLGLLGKNGAGKTTALKILAGMDDASSGIGLVAGHDVEEERLGVYERLGNCPQFDCVWKAQSVQSHLEFYARLKGIEDPNEAALEIATAVGLGAPEVYTRPSGQLSGGMRRRLSIAISLVGSPRVVNLDEPTTGLDPSTRHEIWSLISSFVSPERALIITTHMMIEADTLCSRIAIVSKGRLKVVGTQQHLKDNYGSGYLLQLNLLRNSSESVDLALNFVKDHLHQDARIVARQAKTVGINLPREMSIEKIFTKMFSDSASEVGINQFLVSQSSLEDVFVSLG